MTTIKNITKDNCKTNIYETSTKEATLIVKVRRPAGEPNPITWEVAYDDPKLKDTDWFPLTVEAQDFPIPGLLNNNINITGVTAIRIVPTNNTPAYTMEVEEILPSAPTI